MDIKDAKLFINSDNEMTAIRVTINGEDHLTGDVRHIDLKKGEATGVFSNITFMENDDFVKGWYNTLKECVRYNISKRVIANSAELADSRFNLYFLEFKFDPQL